MLNNLILLLLFSASSAYGTTVLPTDLSNAKNVCIKTPTDNSAVSKGDFNKLRKEVAKQKRLAFVETEATCDVEVVLQEVSISAATNIPRLENVDAGETKIDPNTPNDFYILTVFGKEGIPYYRDIGIHGFPSRFIASSVKRFYEFLESDGKKNAPKKGKFPKITRILPG